MTTPNRNRCPYCGVRCTGKTCHAHSDLPALEAELHGGSASPGWRSPPPPPDVPEERPPVPEPPRSARRGR